MAECEALTNPDSVWSFCPNLPAAYLFAALFGLITVTHIAQAIIHRKLYSLVIIASAAVQLATYVFRILSINNVTNDGFYIGWFVLMMVAPIFTNAYAYMVMARMVYNFTPTARVWKLPAWRFGLIFVLLDIVAFVIQTIGAVIAAGQEEYDAIMRGLYIYMGGTGFQQLCIFAFLALSVRFHLDLLRQAPSPQRSTALTLLYVQYAALTLITARIIFRLVEYSEGFDSAIPNQEAYQYVLDSAFMMVALVLYNIWHPGRLMPGKESDLPSRKERKTLKKQGLWPRGRLGGEGTVEQKPMDEVSDSDLEMGATIGTRYSEYQGERV